MPCACAPVRSGWIRIALAGLGIGVFGVAIIAPRGLQTATANGDTRTISIRHMHTKEAETVTFRRDGSYDRAALKRLNWLLRDWRRDEPTEMDPRLFDLVWTVHREVGSSEAVHVVSAYRSPETNGMLRRRSRGVAKHSQHMQGRAMDFYLPDAAMAKVREIGVRMQTGGVGYYPGANNPFVHLDVGSVRAWPRLSRDQLVRLFPDGKTVHIPAGSGPLPGYELAKAEILSRGGSVAGLAYATADGEQPTQRRSLWAALFGGADEEEDAEYYGQTRRGGRATAARGRPSATQVAEASGYSGGEDAGSRTFFMAQAEPAATQPSRTAALRRLAREATPAPAPATPSTPVAVAALTPAPIPPPDARARELPRLVPTAQDRGPQQASDADDGEQANAAPPTSRTTLPALALAPLPPRRPGELATIAALSNMPLPPTRPVALLAYAPAESATLAALTTAALLAPLEGASAASANTAAAGGDTAAKLTAFAHPAPPARPAQTEQATLVSTDQTAAAVEDRAGSLVLAAHPTPPARPSMAARVETATATPMITTATTPLRERDTLNALFAAATATRQTVARAPVRTAAARTVDPALRTSDALGASVPVAGRFQTAPLNPPGSGRFAGPAVAPLGSMGFVAR